MLKKLLLVTFLLLLSTVSFAQKRSVYSDLSYLKCKRVDENLMIPGGYFGRCAGAGGYHAEVYLDGVRNSFSLIWPSKKSIDMGFWRYFRNYSKLDEKAEWRMKGKTPVALIVRLNVSDQGDGNEPTSYLLVSKITKTNACVTDIVKPGKNQNLIAQKLADKALTKPCQKVEK